MNSIPEPTVNAPPTPPPPPITTHENTQNRDNTMNSEIFFTILLKNTLLISSYMNQDYIKESDPLYSDVAKKGIESIVNSILSRTPMRIQYYVNYVRRTSV